MTGRLSLTCHRSEVPDDEVLIELCNSSNPIHKEVLKVLNSPVPQPMTTEQHRVGSGKRGGSGFGHYFALRVISGFCGGREERRKLDVKLDYD